jgi:acyl carrier protein
LIGDGGKMTAQETGVDGASREQVLEAMTTILARLLQRTEPITENMGLMDELGLSSTLGLELLLGIEDQLDILINLERLGPAEMATVGDMATYVATHCQPA